MDETEENLAKLIILHRFRVCAKFPPHALCHNALEVVKRKKLKDAYPVVPHELRALHKQPTDTMKFCKKSELDFS